MKYSVIIFLCLSILSSSSYSQDIIVKLSGDSISSKVSEIGLNEIKFKKFNNPEGPIYIISKMEVSQIIFNNGEIEHFSSNEEKKELFIEKEINIEEVKRIIIETINAYGYSYRRDNLFLQSYKFIAEFEDNYLKLTSENNLENRFAVDSYYYDFSGKCDFHELSERKDLGISFINVGVPLSYKKKNKNIEETKYKNFLNSKLVIKVEGIENGKKLREALINYNKFFQEN